MSTLHFGVGERPSPQPHNFENGQRVVMSDPDYLGSTVPKGTIGTVTRSRTRGGNVMVDWEAFYYFGDPSCRLINGSQARDWLMDPKELKPAILTDPTKNPSPYSKS